MKFNQQLGQEIERYLQYVIVVEGKKDVYSLRSMGFEKVYAVHQTGVSIKERVEQIISCLEKRDKVCILTDFDKKGKQLYLLLKREFIELGVKVDSSLRGILLKAHVSHIEGLFEFMKRIEMIS